ncbi:hypothetical protein R6Q59_014946 [Mikania micrantha]|uniref:Uncharacterized protein n=1 Tax=Mikania micrantha TaxID=192012 RepID=A0A5N6PGR0_9ASTR|nr:hypothetical protein E3N88_07878 [Mikania micrantha]
MKYKEVFIPGDKESETFSDDIPASSYPVESLEHDTGILMFTMPESSDEYHTPPYHQSCSETSSIEDQIPPPTNTAAFDAGDGDLLPVDDYGESHEQTVVNLPNPSDKLGFSEKGPRVLEDSNTHQVFVEMPQREQEAGNKDKRKIPFSMNTQKPTISSSKNEPFVNILNRVLMMAQESKRSRGGGEEEEDHEDDIDFRETAMRRGLTLPRPRWWPPEGFKD